MKKFFKVVNYLSKKTELIKIRVTPDEKQKIRDNAQIAKMTVSKYMITLVYRKRMIVITEASQLLADVHGVCINLNQIAKVANSQKFVNKSNVEEILKLSAALKKSLDEIIGLIFEHDKDNYLTQPTMTNMRLDNIELSLSELSETLKAMQEIIKVNGSS